MSSLDSRLVAFATAAGATAELIPRKEGWALLQTWREIYCAPVHETTGKWVHRGGPSWHTFSHEFFRCFEGKHAFKAYNALESVDLLVLPEDGLGIRCTSKSPIDFSSLFLDLYIAPTSYEWTMVVTHEHMWLGPYFARAGWRVAPDGSPLAKRAVSPYPW